MIEKFSNQVRRFRWLILLTVFVAGWQIVEPINQMSESIPTMAQDCATSASSPITLSDFTLRCWLIE